jgi:hypothetical protein
MSAGYSRWEDAMIAQLRILEFYQSYTGRRYLASFFEDMNARHRPEVQREVDLLAAIQYTTVKDAEPVWASNDMAELVDHARWSFDLEELKPSDPWCMSGFILFPKPLTIFDMPVTERNPGRAPSGEIPVRAVAWYPVHTEDFSSGAYWISFYVHIDDEEDQNIGRNQPLDEATRRELRRIAPLSLIHQWQWTWGTNPSGWDKAENYDVQPGDSAEDMMQRARQQAQLIQTIWRIGSQFVPVKFLAQRQMRRQAERKGMKHKEVTIITLRRGKPVRSGEPYESGRRLTVRHWVRGYWAKRHFREGTRQVWVRGHIKGREDLPWQSTTRAWEWRR